MMFGKTVERNIGQSLKMANVAVIQDFAMDVQNKIDFLIPAIDSKEIVGGLAVQVSMRDDLVKARVSKMMALRKSSFFVYLLVGDPSIFQHSSYQHGQDLKRVFKNMIPYIERNKAVYIEIPAMRYGVI